MSTTSFSTKRTRLFIGPTTDKVHYSDTKIGYVQQVREIDINGIDEKSAAVGWILHHDYQGAIPSKLGIRGLRARVGNMQVGNDRIFSNVFPEERFCSWTIGEVHLVERRILPNGRRDNFEKKHLSLVIKKFGKKWTSLNKEQFLTNVGEVTLPVMGEGLRRR